MPNAFWQSDADQRPHCLFQLSHRRGEGRHLQKSPTARLADAQVPLSVHAIAATFLPQADQC
jgi:hypothetical protein